jgi:subtilisin-like proprotein convertase family protein/Zn-dependent metalloprotease
MTVIDVNYTCGFQRGTRFMQANHFKKTFLALSIAACLAPTVHAVGTSNTLHNDHRKTIKLDLSPSAYNKSSLVGLDLATQFLKDNVKQYGLESNIDQLVFSRKKSSLLATHFYFQQSINGIPVDNGEIIISVNKQNQVSKVFNNTFPVKQSYPKPSKSILEGYSAEQLVWDYLQVSGKLQSKPKSRLTYMNLGNQFKLVYKINMTVTKPFGDWEFYVDASNGAVVKAQRIDLPISKNANSGSHYGKWLAFAENKKQISYESALSQLEAESSNKSNQNFAKADATATVFDPDPVTTLNNETLEDTSSASSFEAAYFTRTLKDVTLNNGVYSLNGPWIVISDFESPNTAPSTSATGAWTAKRGDNSFNDAMTYFHIDQNQRYMQSLGFVDSTGIQFGPIDVDTDGVDGGDNSHFLPGTNQLAFGHGCVDDNEDIDVILHEYGHAINFSINSSFSGGDTGAMGEGFGDYWAASYSYSTPNGLTVRPEWAFSWDGHNACWGGRFLNRTSYRYDPTKTYAAHADVNGQNGDEVWSAPITQALIELMGMGVSRDEVDQIILEAQFGLGSGLKMPDMAASIVSTASQLFPNGEHAAVLDSHFKTMEILGESLKFGEATILSAGGNTIAEPGETVSLNVELENSGGTTLTAIQATLSSSTSGVAIGTAASSYPNLGAAQSASNTTPFEFSIPGNHTCGEDINLSLAANYTDGTGLSADFDFSIPVGQGAQTSQSSSPSLAIPDNNTTGITDELTIAGTSSNSTVSVDVNITHTYRGDLTITLTSPAGTSVVLQASSNDGTANLVGNYPADLTPANSLSAFDNEDHNGVWSLTVSDSANVDVGTLNSWGINSTSPATCDSNSAPVASVSQQTLTLTEGDNGVVDASSSSDADGDELSFAWSQLSGPTVTIENDTSAEANFVAPTVNAESLVVLQVVVSDENGASDTATVDVTVADSEGNRAPVAAVASNNIEATEGDAITLDASSSSDPDSDTLTYNWSQTSGTQVTLSNADSSIASFSGDAAGTYVFEVSVSDPSGAEAMQSVTVVISPPNRAPVASATTSSSSVNEGAGVTLNASGSSDPDGDNLAYQWSQVSGPAVSLSNAASVSATFTAPEVTDSTTLEFSVTVSDPSGESDTSSVSITVNDVPESSGGGGSLPLISLLLLPLLRRLRK